MSPTVRRGLELMVGDHYACGPGRGCNWSHQVLQDHNAALAWIDNQLKLDDRRRKKRGKYKRSRR